MFERFTENARQVIVLAQEEATGILKHDYIAPEHLLLGLLRAEGGVAASALNSFDVTVEGVRAHIVRIVGSGKKEVSGQIPFTPRAKNLMERALREALWLKDDHIGTEHLLLGLLRDPDSVATRILNDMGAAPKRVRPEVHRLLFEGSAPGLESARPSVEASSFSPGANRALEHAAEEAAREGRDRVGAHHLVLGLLRAYEPEVQRLLEAVEVSPKRFRAHLDSLLHALRDDGGEADGEREPSPEGRD